MASGAVMPKHHYSITEVSIHWQGSIQARTTECDWRKGWPTTRKEPWKGVRRDQTAWASCGGGSERLVACIRRRTEEGYAWWSAGRRLFSLG